MNPDWATLFDYMHYNSVEITIVSATTGMPIEIVLASMDDAQEDV